MSLWSLVNIALLGLKIWLSGSLYLVWDLGFDPKMKKEEEAGRKRKKGRKLFFLSSFLPALFIWDSNPNFRKGVDGSINRHLNYESFDPTPLFGISLLCKLVVKSSYLHTCAPLRHLIFRPSMAQTPRLSVELIMRQWKLDRIWLPGAGTS